MVPVTALVLPMASLGKESRASCSRTRKLASVPLAIANLIPVLAADSAVGVAALAGLAVGAALVAVASVVGVVRVVGTAADVSGAVVEVAGGGDAGRVGTGVAAAAPVVGLGVAGAPGPAQAATSKLIAATVVANSFAVGFT
jgi:hypothetical protein